MNLRAQPAVDAALREHLRREYADVRACSQCLAEPLTPEDQGVQSMPDASPIKWHLAHTTWFFEALVLMPMAPGYAPYDPRFFELFNSYYESLGPRHPRPQRGVLSRPDIAEVSAYRAHVDARIAEFLASAPSGVFAAAAPVIGLGLHHEQQHQELMLTDIKHAFSCNPLHPAYSAAPLAAESEDLPLTWIHHAGGLVEIGHGVEGFAFDNESPRHKVWLEPYDLASRPVTCGEYLRFIEDGGYQRPEFWLSDGWACVRAEQWEAPLYWRRTADALDTHYRVFTLHGDCPLDPAAPVCHLSYYEAQAYAAWAGARLPSEFEWEHAAAPLPVAHRHASDHLHPRLQSASNVTMHAMFGEVWEWTQSAYAPYPGYRPWAGPAAEYNGKFMVNQLVLRGGSCVTPPGHLRATYRNFFPASARWQFSGVRLARDPI